MKKTSLQSRLLSLALCICMVLSMLPGMPLVAKAADTEAHSYTDNVCVCGQINPNADVVASVSKNGKVVGAYATLNDAIQAVKNCTAADEAVVTILKNINLGESYQTISYSVFTIDLNGFEISSSISNYGALYITNTDANVTIQDSGEDGKITGRSSGIEMYGSMLTVLDGTISGEIVAGVEARSSTITVSGGTISGNWYGVYVKSSTVTISGGTISGKNFYGVYPVIGSTMTISGGTISGNQYEINSSNSTTTLTLGEDGVGATFPGGIKVEGITLNELLGEGTGYWQGDTVVVPADGQTEITGGDVIIKEGCKHTGGTATCTERAVCEICGSSYGKVDKTNHTKDTYINGFRDCCGEYKKQPAELNSDGYYEIGNIAQLYWFADHVNIEGDTDANAILLADIDLAGYEWTTICETGLYYGGYGTDLGYCGTFDGNGHIIKNITVMSSTTMDASCGLFGTVSGTIKNLGIEGFTFVDGGKDIRTGAIVGQLITENGKVSNCYVKGATINPRDHVTGGIAGCVYEGTIENCYVVESTIRGGRFGHIVGDSRGDGSESDRLGTVTNCYSDNATIRSDRMGNVTNCETKSKEAFAIGEVTYLLNGSKSEGDLIWYQTIGTDSLPKFAGGTVYKASCVDNEYYSNENGHYETHNFVDGICSRCGEYQPAELNSDGYYEIGNEGQLYWFAQQVNIEGDTDANAILLADIDLAGYEWTTICETGLYHGGYGTDLGYCGTFDGNGHIIKNITVMSSTTMDASCGLFGTVSGTIKNLGIEGFTFVDGGKDIRAGAIVGQLITENGKVSNCYVKGATITPGAHVTGGIAGCVYDGTIENCYVVESTITGSSGRFGYIVGDSRGDGSESDRPGTVINCYSDNATLRSNNVGNVTNCETKSKEVFASGEVTYLLNGSKSEGDLIWYQTIGTDAIPKFAGGTVYKVSCVDAEYYSNENKSYDTHNFVDGICSQCGALTPADNNNGIYEISNVVQYIWFTEFVNAGNPDANAKLMADIDLSEHGNVMIGTSSAKYSGNFDGNGKKLTVNFNTTEEYAAPFRYIDGATIQNLTVDGTIATSAKYAAGLVGSSDGSSTIEKCMVGVTINSSVSGDGTHGGLVAVVNSDSMTIDNCGFIGSITGSRTYSCGGFVGWANGKTTIKNSYMSGTFTTGISDCYTFGRNPDNITVSDSYYKEAYGTTNPGATQKSAEQFASGEVTYLLNGSKSDGELVWYQTLGTDAIPKFAGATVYKVSCVDAECYRNENKNYETHNFVDGICSHCGEYQPAELNSDGYYEIGNEGQLYWFAQQVNIEGDTDANAILLADIDLAGYEWTTICETGLYYGGYGTDLGYCGTFDGNGHIIKNITVKSSTTMDASCGLFGTVSGTIKNLGIEGFTFVDGGKDIRTGAIVGQLITENGKVSNCYVKGATIDPKDHVTGGIAGCVYEGTIENCYVVESTITGASGRFGHIVGDSRGDGSESDRLGTMTNCYSDNATLRSDRMGNVTNCETKSKEAFASGEVTYLLNGSKSEGDLIWYQTIGTDSLPKFAGGTVYKVSCVDVECYSNENKNYETHNFVDGICIHCGALTPADNNDGIYEISNVGQYIWFAEFVNAGNPDANAKLMADIDLSEHGNVMIGTSSAKYSGNFDGNGKKLTVNFNTTEEHTAPFRYINGATIQNLTVDGTIATRARFAAGLVGSSDESSTIEKCMVGVTIKSSIYGECTHGGLVAIVNSDSMTIDNCGFIGSITGFLADSCGGFVGCANGKTTIKNSYMCGTFTTYTYDCYTFGRNAANITVFNSYYKEAYGTTNPGATQKSAEQFASGEVTYLLNGSKSDGELVWYQTLGTDSTPQFTGSLVCYDSTNGYYNHDHNWTYTKDGNKITATCDAKGCPNTNGGYVTIAAPSNLTYTGNEIEAVVDNQLTNGAAVTVIYSGENLVDGKPVYLGSYTATVTLGGQSIQVAYAIDCNHEQWNYSVNEDGHLKYCACGYSQQETHSYNDYAECICGNICTHTGGTAVEYAWYPYEDGSCSVYAVLYCPNCDAGIDSNNGEAELTDSVEGTDCEHPGSKTYSITLTLNGQEFTESKTFEIKNDNHVGQFENGFCSACGGYQMPELDLGEDPEWEHDDVYLVYNPGQLFWVADYVNNGNNDIKVKLMDNIVVPEGMTWTPIFDFYGTFDGNFKTVSGLYVKSEGNYVGMFGGGSYSYGTIKNLHLTDCYFEGARYVGGIAGYHAGTIENCSVDGTVTVVGDGYLGALVGYLAGNVYNCFAYAPRLIGTYSYATVENSFYLSETDDGNGGKTAEQFASGEVAFLLQSGVAEEDIYDEDWNYIETIIPEIWGQTIGEDDYPVLGGKKVYQITDCQGNTGYSNTETMGHVEVVITGKAPTCTEPGLTDGVKCFVCGEIFTAQEEIPATGIHVDADNSGRCDTCNCLMQPALLCKVSASLKGNIALNYYMLLSDEVLADDTAYMQFIMADGEIIKIPVSEGVKHELDGETYYVFTCAVSAKEMTDTVLSQFFYEGGVTREHPYSVQTYAKHILANYDDAATKNLIASMLNYGAASQIHFGYNTDKLANAELAAPDYSGVTIEGFKPVAGQGTELAKLYSASLILKSETTLRFFFTGKITATYNGQELEVKERGGLYYVDVVGISAKDLDEDVTVIINDGSNTAEVSFNPMAYCQGVLNDTTGAFGQDMKDLVAALYLYNQAANAYFKEV